MISKLFRSGRRNVTPPAAQPAPLGAAPEALPRYLAPLVQDVEDHWEAPDGGRFQFAFERYLDERLFPLGQMQDALDEKRLAFRLKVERMMEIAPDLFEKAVRHSEYRTGFLVEDERHDG